MDEKIIPIELNPQIIRNYYENEQVYKDHIKGLNTSDLLGAMVFFVSAVIVSTVLFEKYIYVFFILIAAS